MMLRIGISPAPLEPLRRCPHRKNVAGFTLIELSLVIALLAIIMVVSWPVFAKRHEGYLQETTAQEIADCMSFARFGAIADQTTYQLIFTKLPASFRLLKVSDDEQSGALVPAKGKCGRRRTIDERIELAGDLRPMIFYPNGSSASREFEFLDQSKDQLMLKWNGILGYATIAEKK